MTRFVFFEKAQNFGTAYLEPSPGVTGRLPVRQNQRIRKCVSSGLRLIVVDRNAGYNFWWRFSDVRVSGGGTEKSQRRG